jgi:replicative DNA helicase
MGGFVGGDLVILAGHTSRGKSALAVNLALHSVYQKKRVALVSLEMWEGAMFDRLVSLTGQIDGYELHREKPRPDEEKERRKAIRDSIYAVSEFSIAISYRPGITPKKLFVDLQRFKAVNGLDLVIIDYLQLMSGSEKAGASRAEEVGTISRALKRMAGDLNIPIIALSQFSRESAKQDREPELHDLRESGSIEQDASVVLLMHVTRPWDMAAGIEEGEIKLKIAKQRNGIVSWLPLKFQARTGTFSEPGDYRQ